MDLTAIGQLITSMGFPIVACLLMGYYIKTQTDHYREDITQLNAQHREEMNSITEALNNNTLALQKVSDALIMREKIDDIGNDDHR